MNLNWLIGSAALLILLAFLASFLGALLVPEEIFRELALMTIGGGVVLVLVTLPGFYVYRARRRWVIWFVVVVAITSFLPSGMVMLVHNVRSLNGPNPSLEQTPQIELPPVIVPHPDLSHPRPDPSTSSGSGPLTSEEYLSPPLFIPRR